jgi:hypothetical protein
VPIAGFSRDPATYQRYSRLRIWLGQPMHKFRLPVRGGVALPPLVDDLAARPCGPPIYLDRPHSQNVNRHGSADRCATMRMAIRWRSIRLDSRPITAVLDSFRTPHREQEHVPERFTIAPDGKSMTAIARAEDPGHPLRPTEHERELVDGQRHEAGNPLLGKQYGRFLEESLLRSTGIRRHC